MKVNYIKFPVLIAVFFLAINSSLFSQTTIYSTSAGGPWDSTWTWVGGVVPGVSHSVVINGAVHTSGNSCNSLTLNTNGSLNNTYYGATLTVTGNVINHGTISDNGSNFNLNIGGDITNNGTWDNAYTTLTGSTNHVIACQNGNSFSGYQFQNTGTGDMFINTETYFDNVQIHLNNLNLNLAVNASLKIHDGYLYQCNILGSGSSSVVYGEGDYSSDAPYFQNVSFTDIGFQGDNNFNNGCSTHGTVVNNGLLQNNYYGQSMDIYDTFINNGTIQNWTGVFTLKLYGDFTNNGTMMNNAIDLYSDVDQTITELNGNAFNMTYFTSFKPSGKTFFLTDVDFLGCIVDMKDDTLIIPDNGTLKFEGSQFKNAVVYATPSMNGNLKLDMNETSYISNCHVFNPEILNKVKVKANHFYGNILVTDTLENDYYGYLLNIHGDMTNNGVVQNFGADLTLNIEGDIFNNGVWENSYINLTGSDDQHIECTNGNSLSGYQINNNKSSGDIIIDNIVYFDNVRLHFNSHNLILPPNTLLKMHDAYLYQCNLSGSGETSVVFGEGAFDADAPYFQNVSFADMNFQGDININSYCSTHGTVVNNGSLQNDFYGQPIDIYDTFINNGTVQNWVSWFTLKLYGDITNNGTMTNNAIDLYADVDQTITEINGNTFDMAYLTSFKPSGKIIATTGLTFNNVNINLEHDTLIVPENSTVSLSGNRLYRADIIPETGRFNLFMENNAYMHECNLNEVSLSGSVDCNNLNVFYGTTINDGVFQNDYYSYTVVFNGDFINNGTIKNDVSALTMNMYGNIENNGIWDNTTIGFYSSGDQEVYLDNGQVFSPSYFYSYKPSGKLIALTDLSFDNVDINLEHDTLVMPENSTLSLSGNRLYRSDIHAVSGRFNLFTENNYLHECNLSDATLYGTVNCNNGNTFYGTTINEGILQNDYYQYLATFAGDLINNNTIQGWVSPFIVNVEGDITNNGDWVNYYTQMTGTSDQYIHLQDGHYINGRMVFVSDIDVAPFHWIWNGWTIANPPYPQPAVWSGESSNALNFLVPVANNRLGTYYCSTGGGSSRNIIVDETGSLRVDLTAFLEGPFNGTDMNSVLTTEGFIPAHQPFDKEPWNYFGQEASTNIPDTIVDWVLVDFRDATDAATALTAPSIEKQAAFILNNGSIVRLDGKSYLSIGSITVQNSLFVVITHRNHLSVMSANPLTLNSGVYSYNFNGAGQAYNNGQKNLGGTYVLYGGNADGNGTIDIEDGAVWYQEVGKLGYLASDANLDGQSDNKDKNDIWVDNNGTASTVPD